MKHSKSTKNYRLWGEPLGKKMDVSSAFCIAEIRSGGPPNCLGSSTNCDTTKIYPPLGGPFVPQRAAAKRASTKAKSTKCGSKVSIKSTRG